MIICGFAVENALCERRSSWLRERSRRSWPAGWTSGRRSPSRAGSAPGATRRPGSRSSRSTTARASTRSRSSPRRRLPNYQTEILHLTTHCAVRVAGTLVESQGKGQRFEVKAERVEVVGWVENPDNYPVSAKRHTFEHLRTGGPPPAADQHLRRGRAGPRLPVDGRASLLPRARLRLGPHADHHHQRRRGGRGDVPRLDARPGEPAARRARAASTSRPTSSASRPA